jgi:phage baseplate assembly protein W
MPTSELPIQIHPLDLNKNVAIGVVFPLMNGGSFQQSFTIKDQIKTNIINVLLTEKGERVNNPDFGTGLKTILFENNPNANQIEELIGYQLSLYVPEVEVDSVEVKFEHDLHILYVKLIYTFVRSNEQDSIVININQSIASSRNA